MTRPSEYGAALARVFGAAGKAIGGDGGAAHVDRTRHAEHGDFACNLAMQLARTLNRKPREVAEDLIAALKRPSFVGGIEAAGPGFINVTLTHEARTAVLDEILERGADYGRGVPVPGSMLIEFVSANPTGPIHIGHGRQAAHGSSLANIMRFSGCERVDCEYYINDSGRQMEALGLSLWLRYLQQGGQQNLGLPEDAYEGEYMLELARRLREEHGERFERTPDPEQVKGEGKPSVESWVRCAAEMLGDDFAVVVDYARGAMLESIRSDLADFGVKFDSWISERAVWKSGRVEEALAIAGEAGMLYEKDGAQWFRSTAHGDEKDRVVRRANGAPTYFAADFGYHLDKFRRGYDTLILEAGQDHHGYRPRMKAMVAGLGRDPGKFEMKLFAMVRLVGDARAVKLSTRKGTFVSLRELLDSVGRDAARFTYLGRQSNQALDFDVGLAVQESSENPVYYVQYAHARICSVLREWGGTPAGLAAADGAPLMHPKEAGLLFQLLGFGAAVQLAAREREPHVVAYYLRDLAALFHGYYNEVRILNAPEAERLARLKLAEAVRIVLASGLALVGVSAPERMDREQKR